MPHPRWDWRAVAPAALAVPLIGVLNEMVEPWVRGTPVLWRENPAYSVWALWVALMPLFFCIEHRYPLRRPSASTVLVHLANVFGFVLLHILLSSLISIAQVSLIAERGRLLEWVLFDRLPRYFALDLFGYILTFGIAYGIRHFLAVRDRERLSARLQRELAEAELHLLKTRIDPDLVLEVLGAIAAEAESRPQRAEALIEILGDFLDHVVSATKKLAVPLDREIELTTSYVALENALRGRTIDFQVRIPQRSDHSEVASFSVLAEARRKLRDAAPGQAIEIDLADVETAPLRADEDDEPPFGPSFDAVRSRRLLWTAALAAPFVFTFLEAAVPVATAVMTTGVDGGRLIRTALRPFAVAALVPLVVWVALPRFERMVARAAHVLLVFMVCIVLGTTAEALFVAAVETYRGNPVRPSVSRAAVSRAALLNRILYLAIAAAVIAEGYSRRWREREAERERLRARLAEAELRALTSQLHPHFLFNTLNAVAGLLESQPAAARVMTERLARFLHRTMSMADVHEVPLREELEFVSNYLEIQRARFGEGLHVSFDIDQAALDRSVPTLVLQPLVENSIRHGMAPGKKGGNITIRARVVEGMIELLVKDDGVGAPPDAVDQGVGLSNTSRRLRQLYGDRQRMTFRSGAGMGFEVELLLPIRKAGLAHA